MLQCGQRYTTGVKNEGNVFDVVSPELRVEEEIRYGAVGFLLSFCQLGHGGGGI